MRPTTRRELVAAATATALTAAVPPAYGRMLSRRARIGPGRFRDGVASGEPGDRAVTFWSRLRTDRPRSGARLIVATDEGMDDVVATTVVPTGDGIGGTLKARVGGLDPHTTYHYQWLSANDESDVGRTRTRPPADSALPLRIAFSSCQDFNLGFYPAHASAAAEDLDLYLFLGDYIYERGRPPIFAGRHDSRDASDLDSYRRKYRTYREDANLRELHRLHPMLHIWDDHEVENNYTDNAPQPAPLQRAAAFRAAFEWLPRIVFPRDRHRIYKKHSLGGLADVFLLDERQYRTGNNDGRPRSMLGEPQMSWLLAELKASRAPWKLIAQQVTVAANPLGAVTLQQDKWDAYPEDRARLLGEIERSGIPNVVFLTGDAHVFQCSHLASDFEALGEGRQAPSAVEYVGGSVTSPGSERAETTVRDRSPWVQQYNGRDHGYTLMAMDAANLVTEFRRSDLRSPIGATEAFERFVQPAGANAVMRQTLAPV